MAGSPIEMFAVPPGWRCRWCGNTPFEIIAGAPCVPKESFRTARPASWLVDAGKASARREREVWLFDGQAIELTPHMGCEATFEDRAESSRQWQQARAAA